MAKVTITIEDWEDNVEVRCVSGQPFVKNVSKDNTLAENLAVIAVTAIQANAHLNHCDVIEVDARQH